MITTNVILIKCGKREYLEQLKNGRMFFNSIKNYRNDGTDYRGDKLEGVKLLDPGKISITLPDGTNLFDHVRRPDQVSLSYKDDDDLLMFCAAKVTEKVMRTEDGNRWVLIDAFKNELKKFGDYAILLWSNEVLEHIVGSDQYQHNHLAYSADSITYRDKQNYSEEAVYHSGSPLDVYFTKDSSYAVQNEWRVLLASNDPIELNEHGGYYLDVAPFENAIIMRTEELIEGLAYNEGKG